MQSIPYMVGYKFSVLQSKSMTNFVFKSLFSIFVFKMINMIHFPKLHTVYITSHFILLQQPLPKAICSYEQKPLVKSVCYWVQAVIPFYFSCLYAIRHLIDVASISACKCHLRSKDIHRHLKTKCQDPMQVKNHVFPVKRMLWKSMKGQLVIWLLAIKNILYMESVLKAAGKAKVMLPGILLPLMPE